MYFKVCFLLFIILHFPCGICDYNSIWPFLKISDGVKRFDLWYCFFWSHWFICIFLSKSGHMYSAKIPLIAPAFSSCFSPSLQLARSLAHRSGAYWTLVLGQVCFKRLDTVWVSFKWQARTAHGTTDVNGWVLSSAQYPFVVIWLLPWRCFLRVTSACIPSVYLCFFSVPD